MNWIWVLSGVGLLLVMTVAVRLRRNRGRPPRCPECGHPLPNISSPRCPACGESI